LTADGTGTRRPGGRTARTRQVVMDAVVGELAESGYAGTTVERVAARAGIAKTTIYRRWGGMDRLLADLMAEHAAAEVPVPDCGDLRSDLRALARSVADMLLDPPVRAAFASMLAAAALNPGAREMLASFLAGRVTAMTVIIDRAARRGEVPPGTDGAEVVRTMAILIYGRIYTLGQPVTHALADSVAAIVWSAAEGGSLLPLPSATSARSS
jgi:AcrR family transcriptional regulator